jgi:ABC-2 type transport system ATP-binding protein
VTGLFSRALSAPVVDRVSLLIHSGELFGLLGPNGAGKTTLIKMLATLVTPTSGEAWVNGFPLTQESAIKASLGLVTTDERSFYWRLTGRQNLAFFAHLHPLPAQEIPSRIDELLILTGLQDKADQSFRTYSTGMRQRLAIARALIHRPKILFLDEPTRGLDPPSVRALHHLIRRELADQQGHTIFLTTHWLQEAEELCDRLAILNRGRIQACGTLPELRKMLGTAGQYHVQTGELPQALRATLSASIPSLVGAGTPRNPLTLPDDISTLNRVLDALRAKDISIHAIEREELPLEIIFARFTQDSSTINLPFSTLQYSPPYTQSQLPNPKSQFVMAPFPRIAVAFLQRDWHMETSYRLAFLLEFVSIFFSVAVFYFVGQLMGAQAVPLLVEYGGDYFAFVLVGIAFARYFGVGISSFSNNLRQAQATGTLEAMLTSPTSLSMIILSSSLWNFGLATLQVLTYLWVGRVFLGVQMGQGNILAALVVLSLSIVIFSSLGILAASFERFLHAFGRRLLPGKHLARLDANPLVPSSCYLRLACHASCALARGGMGSVNTGFE